MYTRILRLQCHDPAACCTARLNVLDLWIDKRFLYCRTIMLDSSLHQYIVASVGHTVAPWRRPDWSSDSIAIAIEERCVYTVVEDMRRYPYDWHLLDTACVPIRLILSASMEGKPPVELPLSPGTSMVLLWRSWVLEVQMVDQISGWCCRKNPALCFFFLQLKGRTYLCRLFFKSATSKTWIFRWCFLFICTNFICV